LSGEVLVEPEVAKCDNPNYRLYEHYDKHHDTKFYEMCRPHESRAWTCVVIKHSQRGVFPFFSSYFNLKSFGENQYDIAFLNHLWFEWEMDGPMRIDNLIEEHVTQMEKDETLRPRVYQMEISRLIELFNINGWP